MQARVTVCLLVSTSLQLRAASKRSQMLLSKQPYIEYAQLSKLLQPYEAASSCTVKLLLQLIKISFELLILAVSSLGGRGRCQLEMNERRTIKYMEVKKKMAWTDVRINR